MIYGLTKGQAGPTTPAGDTTKSTIYGNPDTSVDPCRLAISFGASWVGRGFSGDVKGTTALIAQAIAHRGFAFLNVMSPCVTWRGDDQHKELRAKVRAVPADHDRTSAESALRLCGESNHLTIGVLYDVARPTLLGEMMSIRWRAQGEAPPPTRADMLQAFAAV